MSFEKNLTSIIKSSLLGTTPNIDDDFDFKFAFEFSKAHQIIGLAYRGLIKEARFKESSAYKSFEQANYFINYIDIHQKYETDSIFLEFDKNGVDYMPLKGTIIKDIYPSSEMRTMSDADILTREKQKSKAISIMTSLGFTYMYESNHEISFSKNNIYIELHKHLIPTYNLDFDKYFGDSWAFAKNQVGHRYYMSDEDFLIYIFTHFAKHFRDKGAGVKYVVDFYVYLTAKKNLDFTYIKSVLEKLSLLKFYENIVKLIDVWFNDANGDEVTDYLTKKIFSEGVYGSEQNSNKSYALRSVESSKNVNGRNFFIAIFPPYASMRDRYPVLKKAKILLPIFWVFRWVSVICTKPKRISERVKDIKEMPNVAESYREELNFVGLDYNFDK
jgi:hypothetical protein